VIDKPWDEDLGVVREDLILSRSTYRL